MVFKCRFFEWGMFSSFSSRCFVGENESAFFVITKHFHFLHEKKKEREREREGKKERET
jgi:hypothetical protein